MIQRSLLTSLSAMFGLLALGALGGCDSSSEDPAPSQNAAAIMACHLDDGTVDLNADLHACDPQNSKKTTICHSPPGNPANAHTLCVGNPAVPAHLRNHGDYLGPCRVETPCPTPGTGGSPGSSGGSGGDGTGGAAGTPADAGVTIVP